jgi:hypothetical protein
MKQARQDLRFSIKEKAVLKKLAHKHEMNITEYVKCKIFDQNSDLIEEDEKFIAPNSNKQGYFFAFSLVKLNLVLQEMLSKQGFMTHSEYDEFCEKKTSRIRGIISNLGFKKIEKDDE